MSTNVCKLQGYALAPWVGPHAVQSCLQCINGTETAGWVQWEVPEFTSVSKHKVLTYSCMCGCAGRLPRTGLCLMQ